MRKETRWAAGFQPPLTPVPESSHTDRHRQSVSPISVSAIRLSAIFGAHLEMTIRHVRNGASYHATVPFNYTVPEEGEALRKEGAHIHTTHPPAGNPTKSLGVHITAEQLREFERPMDGLQNTL